MTEITVNLPPPAEPYSIIIEPGLLARVGVHVRAVAPHSRCLLAMDRNVAAPHAQHADIVLKSLRDSGYEVATATLVAEEKQKTLASVELLYRAMLDAKLERKSPVIALGGGIVGDVAGYAAATYLRGVPLVHVPTTLLAMVDASIGGKTGVNFPLPGTNDLGKNLIGAFWQPRVVLADPKTLLTLRHRDLPCGLAECIKHAVIADAPLLQWIYDHAKDILGLSVPRWQELIERCARIKAAIVAEDERESGRRALLNLGHTFGHAIESVGEWDVRHGEAVAIGLDAASHVATSLGRLTKDQHRIIRDTISRCGLTGSLIWPVLKTVPLTEQRGKQLQSAFENRANIDRMMRAMTFDKKVVDGRMRLVLPRGIGAADVVDDVPESLIRDAWRHVGARE